jgi:NAD(P)-dependent dehydrogenase (short-subunit alcohol dehydrogenase family)
MSGTRLCSGKVALVTGSTQGLGEGIATRLLREGARVVTNGRSASKGAAVLEKLRRTGGEVDFICADLTQPTEPERLVAAVIERFGRIDILVNNAQITPPYIQAEAPATEDYLQQAMTSGLYASLRTSRSALSSMREHRWGRIINFGSINGSYGSRYGTAYNAAKEAIRGLTRTLANEWGEYGITVNAVLPSGWSPAFEAFYRGDEKKAAAVAKQNPMRRHGRADEDIGGAIAGLASESARFITGESLYIDGGAHLLGLPQLASLGTQFS